MQEKELNEGRVYGIIGTALGFGFIAPEMLPYAIIILLICIPVMFKAPLKGLFLFVTLYGLFWIMVGGKPKEFFEKFKKPKKYIAEEPQVDFDRGGIPKMPPTSKTTTDYKIHNKRKTFHHIEREFLLRTYGQIELENKEIGFYLLQRGPQAQIIFCWEVSGYDPALPTNKSFTTLRSATDALNQLPGDIDLKFYQEGNATCDEYSKMQAQLLDKNLDPLTKEIIKSRGRRGKALADAGRMQDNSIYVFGKYRVPMGVDFAIKQSWMDDFLSKTQPLVSVAKGERFDSQEAWEKVFAASYSYAHKTVANLLTSNKAMGWKVRSLNVHKMFERDYLELHVPPVPPVPQYVVYNESGLQPPIINSSSHALATLFEPQKGIDVIPDFKNSYIYLPRKNKYAAFLRIGQISRFPEDKESVSLGYLRYLWNAIADNTNLYDFRIVSEITIDRSHFEKMQLDRLISNSVKREADAANKRTIDVVAMNRREQAVEARNLLDKNHFLFWSSLGIWIYRDTREQLEQDIKQLGQDFTSPTVRRIEFGIQDIWLQSLPWEWSALLTKPNHHRKKYISFQALATLPLIKHRQLDEKGMMFLTRELNIPLYLDIAGKQNHTGIFAKTGVGKSNIILEMLIEYIISDGLVVLFDFPRPDGSSTYTTLIPFLQKLGYKAAYHDIRSSTVNIIEMPDLRQSPTEKKRQERWDDAFQSHVRLLCTIVMGVGDNPDREILVNSLIGDCYYDFHSTPEIQQRYREAINGGYGSPAYQKMPILQDFVSFAKEWFKNYLQENLETASELSRTTIDLILIQLNGVLKTPLGRAINGISSFNTNTNLLVIGLTNVSENLDSLLYAMTGLNALYRGAFSAKRSLLAIDEGTILYKFNAFARETGIIPVHGRKWGCNFLIAAQEIKTIQDSIVGGEIFKNLDNILCGHIGSPAIREMLEIDFEEKILQQYLQESFKPSKKLLQSYWYFKRGDRHIELTHPPSELLLALGATDPIEEKAKAEVLEMYPDKVKALLVFAEINSTVKQSNISFDVAIARKKEELKWAA